MVSILEFDLMSNVHFPHTSSSATLLSFSRSLSTRSTFSAFSALSALFFRRYMEMVTQGGLAGLSQLLKDLLRSGDGGEQLEDLAGVGQSGAVSSSASSFLSEIGLAVVVRTLRLVIFWCCVCPSEGGGGGGVWAARRAREMRARRRARLQVWVTTRPLRMR